MMPKEKWRSGYTTTTTSDPHSSLGNKTPAEARRAFEQFKGSANDALAQNET
jgi:putative transposase